MWPPHTTIFMSLNNRPAPPFVTSSESSSSALLLLLLGFRLIEQNMGMAMRCILVLFSVSPLLLLFNLEMLEDALHLANHDKELDVAAITPASFSFMSRFRIMLGMSHHHRSQGRRHKRSSEAPAPAPAPVPALQARSEAPAPLVRVPRKGMPSTHRSHIAPARSPVHRMEDGGHTKLPRSTIVALGVVGLCLVVLGATIVALSVGRSRKVKKVCTTAFKTFCHGSRDQRSPAATRKVSSHPSPDPFSLSSIVQYQENHPNLKQSSEPKSLSIQSTIPMGTELIASDPTVTSNNSHSGEVESFHSISCADFSVGSITEVPQQICDKTIMDPSRTFLERHDSPSDSSYQSVSPDCTSCLSPKDQTSSAFSHHNLSRTPCPEKPDKENAEVNCHKGVKINGISGSTEHHKDPMEEQTETITPSITKPSSKESSKSSTGGSRIDTFSSMGIPKSPPPPPPQKNPPSLKGQCNSQPPPPPPLPLQIQVGKDGSPLPRLKPLHWDKVRAAPARPMVWNDIRSSSFEFEFDEQMIKSLFAYNFQGSARDQEAMSKTVSTTKHVIEHHRLQNTTILLKTLNANTSQVCNSVIQGNGLSVQQLEALVKMKPTKEEEEKLLNYAGDINMLDPAENFVKVLLTIPMAFPRMEIMLYKENFDDEVSHIKMSFAMIEGACIELKSSKLFLRLLEAVLKTGNRMNVGTLRGGASAFKLDALLKLADIRGADGKTTLLHFVVQEMARSKGLKGSEKLNEIPSSCPDTPTEREEYSSMGTEFVSKLSNELGNVKKVASIDLDTLRNSISYLSCGLVQLKNLVENDLASDDNNNNFLQCMKSFLDYAENTMQELKDDESQVLLKVRELTEYYHGEVSKDESNLLQIFITVKDFLGLLDRVCREMRGTKHNQTLNLVLPLK
ncbi:formin-like protein 9 [Oryza brachyantha]|nr:formin-like protein 9 [Oryza brachyantha]